MAKKQSKKLLLLFFVLGLAIGIALGKFVELPRNVTKSVKEFYELAIPGSQAEVISLSEESGLYKAVVKVSSAEGVSYREAWVTKDGRILTENIIYLQESVAKIKQLKDFVDCLASKGVKIYGVLNQTEYPEGASATSQQLSLLGRYSSKLYVSCDGSAITNCLSANVTEVPSIVFNGKVYPGVKAVEWFENQTGCKMK